MLDYRQNLITGGQPMKKSLLILFAALMAVMLCGCFADTGADAGTVIPPATDTPPITADTPDSGITDAGDQTESTDTVPDNAAADTVPPADIIIPDTVKPDTMVTTPAPPKALICIDPGHGGKDSGAVWDGRIEKDDALALALKVAEQIEALGHKAILTRDDDSYPYFSDRADLANNAEADLFISLHRNSAQGAKGVELWIHSQADKDTTEFAKALLNALADVGISKNRGIKKGTVSSSDEDYFVNKLTNMPSCIVELGFIQSDEDNRLYDEKMDEYALAIAEVAIEQAMLIRDQAK